MTVDGFSVDPAGEDTEERHTFKVFAQLSQNVLCYPFKLLFQTSKSRGEKNKTREEELRREDQRRENQRRVVSIPQELRLLTDAYFDKRKSDHESQCGL